MRQISVEQMKKNISVAAGRETASVILKNLKIVNVFTHEIIEGDIAICDDKIVGIGSYDSPDAIDCKGKTAIPGLMDAHIHLESAMVSPREFAKAVVPHGTTTVITDPHEIANVAGQEGIKYMLEATKNLPLDVFFMLPSCVPATEFDESGATLLAEELEEFYQKDRVLGLAELMNYVGAVAGDDMVLKKTVAARTNGGRIDGHAPNLAGKELNAYICAGARSDHECSNLEEAIEKIRCGQSIMIREGTAAKNLESLMGLFEEPYYHRCMLATDDRHPGDLYQEGHIDFIIKKAAKLGADKKKAIAMATINTARYFGLEDYGAIAPGYFADIVILDDLEHFETQTVYKHGKQVYQIKNNANSNSAISKKAESQEETKQFLEEGVCMIEAERDIEKKHWPRVYDSVKIQEVTASDLSAKVDDGKIHAIGLVAHELYTRHLVVEVSQEIQEDDKEAMREEELAFLSVVERHHGTGHIGNAYIKGYGLQNGAIASSVAHDSHNIIVAGMDKQDMAIAIQHISEMEGGLCIVCDGKVVCDLALPIAGLMSEESVEVVDEKLGRLKEAAAELGVSNCIDPFMTLAFVSLPVIPEIRLTSLGLIDVVSHNKIN